MRQIPAVLTKLTREESAYWLKQGWSDLYNDYPTDASLALLWAQWAEETGNGKSIYCYNFGNIRPDQDTEFFCQYKCSEIVNGKEIHYVPPDNHCNFRAYKSVLDGASDYIKFLSQKTRYVKAWSAIAEGDVQKFGHELRVAGYYTASESTYTHNLTLLVNEFKQHQDEILNWKPDQDKIPTTPPPSRGTGDIHNQVSIPQNSPLPIFD